MSDRQSVEDMTKDSKELEEEPKYKLADSDTPKCCSDKKHTTSEKRCEDKSIHVNMDCEPGEDPKKNKKFWQDLAGLRGAREQYLQQDVRDLRADKSRQTDYINYLEAKLDRAIEEIRVLKARRCRCDDEKELEIYKNKSCSSIGL